MGDKAPHYNLALGSKGSQQVERLHFSIHEGLRGWPMNWAELSPNAEKVAKEGLSGWREQRDLMNRGTNVSNRSAHDARMLHRPFQPESSAMFEIANS